MIDGLDAWEEEEAAKRRAQFAKDEAAVKAKMAADPVPEATEEVEDEDEDEDEDA